MDVLFMDSLNTTAAPAAQDDKTISSSESSDLIHHQEGHWKLSWRKLTVTYVKKHASLFKRTVRENIEVLHQVDGEIQSGRLMAIMGQSGAGKTSLLAAISMRIDSNTRGSLMLNDYPVSKDLLTSISGFVPQQDLTFNELTVYEHLMFMARMKMDKKLSAAILKNRINSLIRQLGLHKVKRTILGSLSGGERKRLSLAEHLINDPPVLFCDEPTTGLDSWTAADVVRQLRSLAASGKAIVCTIHQPASGIFDLFDDVTLLAGGRVAYAGPVVMASQFFADQGFLMPNGFNEAEFLVSVISNNIKAQKLVNSWDLKTAEGTCNTLNGVARRKEPQTVGSNYGMYFSIEKPGVFTQFNWLIWRSIMAHRGRMKITLLDLAICLMTGFIIALPYAHVLDNIDQTVIQNIQGLLYMVGCELIFICAYSVIDNFMSETAILLREIANGLYNPGPYYLSKALILIPKATLFSILYGTLMFKIIGIDGSLIDLAMFLLPLVLAANTATAYGICISASFESSTTATLISVPVDLIGCIFAGIGLKLASMPPYLLWIKYLSIFFCSTEAMSILQWRGVDEIACDPRAGLPCIKTGREVLDMYGYGVANYGLDVTNLVLLFLGYHMVGYVALVFKSKRRSVY